MTFYLVIYLLLSSLALLRLKTTKASVLLLPLLVFLFVFVGTRLDTGCDFSGYMSRFHYALFFDFGQVLSLDEPGFRVLTYLIRHSGLGYMWLNMACALIFFVGAYRFLVRHPEPIALLAIMLPIMIIQLSMSGIRQATAIAFLMLALVAFMDNKRLKVAIYILVGATFHQSLVLMLPLALVAGRTFSAKRLILGLVALGPVALFMLSGRLEVYSDRYIDQIHGSMESTGGLLRLALLVFTAVIFELNKKKVEALFPKQFPMMRIFSLITFALIPIALISTVAVHRLGYYVLPVQLFMLAILPLAMFNNIENRFVGRLIPLAIYGLYLVVWFSTSRHAQLCYAPYDSYLF